LEAQHLEERVREINFKAAKLAAYAREITGQQVFIAGAVGPTGDPCKHLIAAAKRLRDIYRNRLAA